MAIGNITFDCADPSRLAKFWAAALGYEKGEFDPSGNNAWAACGDRTRGQQRLYFQRVPEPKVVKNRVHLDLNVPDMEAEVARLVALGARKDATLREDGETWTRLWDPEGNEFCVQPGAAAD